ncbi:MAG: hypothetical protein JWM97_2820 [Phycisphaerales bacterium]|nr:hypothetical protein [Phycisphaerales bacterium]
MVRLLWPRDNSRRQCNQHDQPCRQLSPHPRPMGGNRRGADREARRASRNATRHSRRRRAARIPPNLEQRTMHDPNPLLARVPAQVMGCLLRKNSIGLTAIAAASLSRVRRVMFSSHRSMAPMYVRCRSARPPSSSCDHPRSLRRRRAEAATTRMEPVPCTPPRVPR